MRNAQLTKTGFERLQKELQQLKEQRVTTIQEVKAARELGDLRENADYHAAREAYGWIEGRIKEIEAKLENAEIVDHAAGTDEVLPGIPVKVRNESTGRVFHYTVVDASEVQHTPNGISMDSPLGEGLLYLQVGDEAEVEGPGGLTLFTIVAIGE